MKSSSMPMSVKRPASAPAAAPTARPSHGERKTCLLYTSDAADERSSVDLGGRRIIKKKRKRKKVAGTGMSTALEDSDLVQSASSIKKRVASATMTIMVHITKQ